MIFTDESIYLALLFLLLLLYFDHWKVYCWSTYLNGEVFAFVIHLLSQFEKSSMSWVIVQDHPTFFFLLIDDVGVFGRKWRICFHNFTKITPSKINFIVLLSSFDEEKFPTLFKQLFIHSFNNNVGTRWSFKGIQTYLLPIYPPSRTKLLLTNITIAYLILMLLNLSFLEKVMSSTTKWICL